MFGLFKKRKKVDTDAIYREAYELVSSNRPNLQAIADFKNKSKTHSAILAEAYTDFKLGINQQEQEDIVNNLLAETTHKESSYKYLLQSNPETPEAIKKLADKMQETEIEKLIKFVLKNKNNLTLNKVVKFLKQINRSDLEEYIVAYVKGVDIIEDEPKSCKRGGCGINKNIEINIPPEAIYPLG